MLTHGEMIARIAIGAGLGGIIGFERDFHGRHVGLRTHLIVAMASATFMIVSAHFVFFQGYDSNQHVEVDASRIAASVVSGIGFLAGGAILRTGATVQGLTTAAGLWLVTAIGLCAGAGMFPESIAVTLMGLVALTVLRCFEDKNDKMIRRSVSLRIEDDTQIISKLKKSLKAMGALVTVVDYVKKKDDHSVGVTLDVRIPIQVGFESLISQLEKQEGIFELRVKIPD
jgi:putative Mg2+ transporter-C (MgtC) family protein